MSPGKLVLLSVFLILLFPAMLSGQGNSEFFQAKIQKSIESILGDVEENSSGEIYVNSSDLEMVFDGGNQIVGLRFTDISLPNGAQIDRAYIQFSVDETSSSTCRLNVNIELTDNALPLAEISNNISNRTFSSTTVNWNPGAWTNEFDRGPGQRTPDLKDLVGEIISRDDWEPGNALLFRITGSGNRTAIAYDRDPALGPQLIIEASIPTATEALSGLYINELMAAGNRVLDDTGEPSDWVEIYNGGNEAVNIGGLYLTDDFTNPLKWRLLSSVIIPAGGFAVLWLDGEEEQGANHASFKLSKDGEELALVQVLDDQNIILDQIIFPELQDNVSYGRQLDGQDPWVKFSELSPESSNDGKGRFLDAEINFSADGGIYSSQVSLSMSSSDLSADIHYSTDGTEPTLQSQKYNAPISLSNTQIVRAKAFKPGFAGGTTTTETYIIRENHSLPVITLQTEPENLFDDMKGIYVQGRNGAEGFCANGPRNWNQDWERPCALNFYEEDGTEAFAINAGMKIGGGCSRGLKMKSMNFYFRKNLYGDGKVKYPVFPQSDIQEYNRLKIRNSGNDFVQMGFRDGAIQSMLYNTIDIDLMAYRPVVAYVNGSYWGIYGLRELYNEDYVGSHHDVDPENLDIITNPYAGGEVQEGDGIAFGELVTYFQTHDLSNQSNYEYVASQIDINEFLNYYIVQIYLANYDWPANNLRVWRERENGKWRWMLYDLDASSGFASWSASTVNHNTLDFATTTDGDWWPNGPHSTLFLRKLLENTGFRNEFVHRTSSYSKLLFHPDRVNQVTDSIRALLSPEIVRHQNKWTNKFWEFGGGNPGGGSRGQWETYIRVFKAFFVGRFNAMRNHMRFQFNLSQTYQLTFNHTENTPGKVYFHSNELEIPAQFKAEYFQDLPLKIKAVPNPGFVFLKWEETGETSPEIEFEGTGTGNTTLTPVFVKLEPSITEIHYNPKEGEVYEFIEMFNPSVDVLDISGYHFSEGIEFTFPQGSSIAPGEFLLLAKDKALYANISCNLFQWTSGDLDNAGEVLELLRPDNRIADRVSYSSKDPWPLQANGMGNSLSLEKPYLDNQIVENWITSTFQGGTPCGEKSPIINTDEVENFIVRIYPNPISSELNVVHATIGGEPLHLEILSIDGQRVLEHDFESNSFERTEVFPLENLAAGTYILKFGDEKMGIKHELLVKQ